MIDSNGRTISRISDSAASANTSADDGPIADRDRLLALLGLPRRPSFAAKSGRPLLVPRSFVQRMNPDDAADPLLRQVLPVNEEDDVAEGFSCDPVGDDAARINGGLLQKYKGRALLLTTGACSIHCRFCFRRNTAPNRFADDVSGRDNAVRCLKERTDIRELILSGGDPLTLSPDVLERLLLQVGAIDHIDRIRIHTRMPIADPRRVNDDLAAMLSSSKKTTVIVLHTNHPNELNDETAAAADLLLSRSLHLLNQSVLLKGVNDTVDTLVALSEKMLKQHILPYYLHQLDKAEGVRHFEVPVSQGVLLMEEMRKRCPGYLVPRYVQEVAGMPSKTGLL